jgi:hypothetical protein
MFSEFSMAVMDSLLQLQADNGISGHLVEFGVYKGRSLALLGRHAKTGERLIGVDVTDYLDRAHLAESAPGLEFVRGSSEEFRASFSDYRRIKRRCRLLHIDSSHFFSTTIAELKMSNELICDHGMVVLDDFTNTDYSQILAATYNYLYTYRTQLCVFLVTAEKAYLCRKSDFPFYGGFVLDRIVDEMAARGMTNTCIARTDINPNYRAFSLRPRLGTEQDKRYGSELYKGYYQQP